MDNELSEQVAGRIAALAVEREHVAQSEQIRARIAALAAERDQVQREAERRLFGYAAAIGELERLLAQLQEGETNATAS